MACFPEFLRSYLRISLREIASILLALLVTVGAVAVTVKLPAPRAVAASELQLTHGAADHQDPIFSPDGKYIVFSSNQLGSFDMWLISTDGKRQVRLTSMVGDERSPKWGPDRRTVAFIWKHETFSDLCLMETVAGNVKCVTSGEHVGEYAWSPNGRTVAYDDMVEGNIHFCDVVTGANSIFQFNMTVREPAFGTSSGTLYFAAETDWKVSIWSANLDGSNPRRLSWLGSDGKPQISPTGDKVLYLTNFPEYVQPRLIDTDGKNSRLLFETPNIIGYGFPPSPSIAPATVPRWSPDGTEVLIVSGENGSTHSLFVATLNVTVTIEPVTPTEPQEYVMTVFNKIPISINVLDAQWGPDEKSIVLVSNELGSKQLFLLRIGSVATGYETR